MALLEQLKQDRITFIKSGNKLASSTLAILIGDIETGIRSEKPRTSEADHLAVVKKYKKSLIEMQALAPSESNLIELALIEKYLPQLMSEAELRIAVKEACKGDALSVGDVMAYLKAHYAGLYDGRLASLLAAEYTKPCENY